MDGQKVENGIHTKGVADFRKKTAAKAAGLKSTFILDAAHGELLMTSFGKGNEANLEKRIYQNKITDLRSTKQFDVTQERKSDYILKNSRLKDLRIATDNPSHSREKENYLLPGMDQLRRKSVLEHLVYINARYVMAFHCWERDCYLYGSEFTPDAAQKSEADIQKWTFNHVIKGKNRSPDYRKLTQYFIAQNYLKKRPRTYLTEDCAHVDDGIIHLYRNQVAHLAAVRDAHECAGDIGNLTSYFQLYHYIMQRALQKKIFADRVPETVAGYFTHLDKCHTYSKDFTKALNTPFGYNLARFKNLSVDELFDRNRSK